MKRRKKKKFDNSRGGKVYEYMWGPSEFFAQGILKNYHQVDRLKEIKVPTLILVGKHDEATPETAKNYAKKIIGANFKVIKNASHAIPEENPKEFWRVVTAFLKNINCVNRF